MATAFRRDARRPKDEDDSICRSRRAAPHRANISGGPWRDSRHASHARKLARDRALVVRAVERAARVVASGTAGARGGGRGDEGAGERKRGVLKRD